MFKGFDWGEKGRRVEGKSEALQNGKSQRIVHSWQNKNKL